MTVPDSRKIALFATAMGLNEFSRGFLAGYRNGAFGALDMIRVHGLPPNVVERAFCDLFTDKAELGKLIVSLKSVITELESDSQQ